MLKHPNPALQSNSSLINGFSDILYFRTHPECTSQADLVSKVSPLLPTLKRTDGSHYNEDGISLSPHRSSI